MKATSNDLDIIAENPGPTDREIPFNYTSAGDMQALSLVFDEENVRLLEELRDRRVTGRSARLLMRIIGELLIHRRNPYLYQELIDSHARRVRLFEHALKDLDIIEETSNGESRVLAIVSNLRKYFFGFREEIEQAPDFRRKVKKELGAIVGVDNVLFDPFSLVSHATDATDWRLFSRWQLLPPTTRSRLLRLLPLLPLSV